MLAPSFFTCHKCGSSNQSVLGKPSLLLCKSCNAIVIQNGNSAVASPVPDDWSFVKLNTTGTAGENPFTVIGQVRAQLRNDYKNFWCCMLRDGKTLWLMESFGSFALFQNDWQPYNNDIRMLRAGSEISVKNVGNIKGEYVEKCEEISFSGELGSWKIFEPGFFLIQASNNDLQTVVFTISGKKDIYFLSGTKVAVKDLKLNNIIEWDEWK